MKLEIVEYDEHKIEVKRYESTAGHSLNRETGEHPITGNMFFMRWVLRLNGEFVDVDENRHDLAERNEMEIQYKWQDKA